MMKTGRSVGPEGPTRLTRRQFGALGLAASSGVLLSSCGSSPSDGAPIRIGFVSPRTGYDSHLTAADGFVLEQVRRQLEGGLVIGDRRHPVEIQEADSTSEPGAAAEVAQQLVDEFGVIMLIATTGAQTTVEVAEVAEVTGTPCLTGYGPWQSWVYGRDGDPDAGFIWSFHVGWGFEDLRRINNHVFSALAETETVGLMWPGSADGESARDEDYGLVSSFAADGFGVLDPGPVERLPETFEPWIGALRDGGAGFVSGLLGSPDVLDFRGEADLVGYAPLAMTLALGGTAPSIISALGPLGDGITCEVAWSRRHPFSSSLTGQTSADIGVGYQPFGEPPPGLGATHALFEVAIDALVRSGDPTRKRKIIAALEETDLDTIVGPISFPASPVRNVAKLPVVAGQWRVPADGEPVLDLVESNTLLGIEANATVRPLVSP